MKQNKQPAAPAAGAMFGGPGQAVGAAPPPPAVGGSCQYEPPKENCFIGECDLGEEVGCQGFPDLRTAQAVCSDNPKCAGLTEYRSVPGQRVFETRSGPGHGDSPAGERCHLKIRAEGKCP